VRPRRRSKGRGWIDFGAPGTGPVPGTVTLARIFARARKAREGIFGDRTVNRLGYGAMQLAGPGVFGPPKDRDAALAVLREEVASGVNHIDTSDFYAPHVTNELIY